MREKRRDKLSEEALRYSLDLLRRYGKEDWDLMTVAYLMQLAYVQGFIGGKDE